MKKYWLAVLLLFVFSSTLFPQGVNKNVMLGVPKDSDSTDCADFFKRFDTNFTNYSN